MRFASGGVAWAPLVQAFLLGFVGHVGTGEHVEMGKLQAGDDPVPPDGVCRIGGAGWRVEDALVEAVGVGAVCGGMCHALGYGHRRRTALVAQLIKRRWTWGRYSRRWQCRCCPWVSRTSGCGRRYAPA